MALDDPNAVDVRVILSSLQIVDFFIVKDVSKRVDLHIAHLHIGVLVHPFLSSALGYLKGQSSDFLKKLGR